MGLCQSKQATKESLATKIVKMPTTISFTSLPTPRNAEKPGKLAELNKQASIAQLEAVNRTARVRAFYILLCLASPENDTAMAEELNAVRNLEMGKGEYIKLLREERAAWNYIQELAKIKENALRAFQKIEIKRMNELKAFRTQMVEGAGWKERYVIQKEWKSEFRDIVKQMVAERASISR